MVAVVLVVLLVVGWAVADFTSGLLSAIAIGTGVAVAIFSGTQRTCAPRLLRRREH
ncbi:MAG TPA: hypothetical protein VH816_11135 [Gaiellaceae bacterium]